MSSLPPPEMVVNNRFLGFLIWQSITSTFIFIFFKLLLLLTIPHSPSSPLLSLFSFLSFHLSLLFFSASLSLLSSPQPFSPASPLQLAFAFLRFLFVSADSISSPDFRRRAFLSFKFLLFALACSLSGFLSLSCFCGGSEGSRGFVLGLVYASFYVYKQRWILEFPIIQRPPFFSFKMRLPLAIKKALKLSTIAYLISAAGVMLWPANFRSSATISKFIAEQIILCCGIFSVFLCWELSHHLHQVLNTKRFVFAPPIGSAAAETNPSEPLLAALEESSPGSLAQHLAYLDLCMACENNVDTWRRAAFFEETGETYKRVIAVCLRPLEELTTTLAEGFDSQLSMKSETELPLDSNFYESLNKFQQCVWCARAVAFLTARSHMEDRFGVAQLSRSNAAVVSTLISCLLSVEAYMGKKTNLQPPNQMGSAGIKWATPYAGRRDVVVVAKKKSGPLYSKAFVLADVLRTSIYCIVSAFHDEMVTGDKAGLLEKDWLISCKPIFGTCDMLLQKLRHFLDFRAS